MQIIAITLVLAVIGAAGVVWSQLPTPLSTTTAAASAAGHSRVQDHLDDNLNGSNRASDAQIAARTDAAKAKANTKANTKAGTTTASGTGGFTPNHTVIPGTGKVYLGAVGDVPGLSRATGLPLSRHAYAHFGHKVPVGRMISVRATGTWRDVAGARPGSVLYNDIVRWAQTIKARGGPIMFAYHHEPEGKISTKYGTAADFIQAYRRVVTIFRAQGVRNVIYTWQMTDWAFRVSASSPKHAAKWYPGNAYVDSIGADAYNWAACGEGSGRWMELSQLGEPVLAFARARGKKASFPEFAAHADSRRAQWVYNALRWIAANRSMITGAFYFQHPPTVAANNDCKWLMATAGEYVAYAALGRIHSYFIP